MFEGLKVWEGWAQPSNLQTFEHPEPFGHSSVGEEDAQCPGSGNRVHARHQRMEHGMDRKTLRIKGSIQAAVMRYELSNGASTSKQPAR
jgi:hypothetical protein